MLPFMMLNFSVYRHCSETKKPGHCEVGDLAHKHANLAVAGRRRDIAGTRRFFTDTSLPLTGPAAIIGHSVVVHDDHAPKHRGNRMACTAIKRLYRHKVSLNFPMPSILLDISFFFFPMLVCEASIFALSVHASV